MRFEKDSALWQVHKETPLYSDLDVEYQQAYSGPYEPLDFGGIIAALKDNQITGYGRPVVGDLSKDECQRLYAISHDIYYMDFLIDGNLSNLSRFLLKKGHIPKPYYTQIIDLTQSEEKLHEGLRKSYAHLANRYDKIYFAYVDRLRELHKKVTGRITRPKITWDIQQNMIFAKQAFCILQNNIFLPDAGVLIYYNDYSSYYGVACSLEGVSTHALLWKAILHAKSLGCRTFDMGEQVFSGDTKLMGISKFKRGFGGEAKVRLLFGKDEQ